MLQEEHGQRGQAKVEQVVVEHVEMMEHSCFAGEPEGLSAGKRECACVVKQMHKIPLLGSAAGILTVEKTFHFSSFE